VRMRVRAVGQVLHKTERYIEEGPAEDPENPRIRP
jgi:hypothetical protein